MEQSKLKRFKRILPTIVLITVIGIATLTLFMSGKTENNMMDAMPETEIDSTVIDSLAKDSVRTALILEVSNYIQSRAPRAHANLPEYIVDAALLHDIDICFMMAQTQVETNFGVLGAGREISRRSLFGVAKRRYPTYESAVNDYCELLKRSYLGRGKDEHSLMKKYVTHSGKRYAASPKYEIHVSQTYKDIARTTNIKSLQKDFNDI